MSKNTNKYIYLWVVQQKTDWWEDVSASESFKEAREDKKSYQINQPEYDVRIIKRRELNPELEVNNVS